MIHFNFAIRNPWASSKDFKNLWFTAFGTPFKRKFIEMEVYKDSTLITLHANITTRQDHAGFDFEIGLFGYCFHFTFYDNRHWDYEKGTWEVYDLS